MNGGLSDVCCGTGDKIWLEVSLTPLGRTSSLWLEPALVGEEVDGRTLGMLLAKGVIVSATVLSAGLLVSAQTPSGTLPVCEYKPKLGETPVIHEHATALTPLLPSTRNLKTSSLPSVRIPSSTQVSGLLNETFRIAHRSSGLRTPHQWYCSYKV